MIPLELICIFDVVVYLQWEIMFSPRFHVDKYTEIYAEVPFFFFLRCISSTYHGITDQITQVAFAKSTFLKRAVEEDQGLTHILRGVVSQVLPPLLDIS